MPFSWSESALHARRQRITRRLGWADLQVGEELEAFNPDGDPLRSIAILRVRNVRREPIGRLLEARDYGFAECAQEGFANHPELQWPSEFVAWFCEQYGCTQGTEVTRIEFEYATSAQPD